MIIGITGTIGAGKGTVVEYLVAQGFTHYSVRNFLVEEIERRGLPVIRDNMVVVANDFRKISPGYIIETLLSKASTGCNKCVIESIRSVGEIEMLRTYQNTTLFAVTADPRTRYERVLARKSVTDNLSYETFLAEEEREAHSDDPNKQNLIKCIALADHVLLNDGSKEELFAKIETIVQTMK